MKKLLVFLLLSVISFGAFAQAPSKKCPTCGQSMVKYQYKGKHPQNTHNFTVQKKKPTRGVTDGHEWVDLGLPSGTKWATMNVGATSSSDYGELYAWGEIQTKQYCDWDNYFDSLDKSGADFKFYKIGSRTQILPTSGHDVAYEKWGGTWRIPTNSELTELRKKCKCKWNTKNGHKGYTVLGPNGNSIFLPAAGCDNGSGRQQEDSHGEYWTSTLSSNDSYDAHRICFGENFIWLDSNYRRVGRSVRPVTK